MNHFPIESGLIFPHCAFKKDFGKVPGDIFVKIKLIQKSSKEYLSRNYVHMYDLSFFDLFLGKGFPSCKGEKNFKENF